MNRMIQYIRHHLERKHLIEGNSLLALFLVGTGLGVTFAIIVFVCLFFSGVFS